MNFVTEHVYLFFGCGYAQLFRCFPQIFGWFDLEITDRAVTVNMWIPRTGIWGYKISLCRPSCALALQNQSFNVNMMLRVDCC